MSVPINASRLWNNRLVGAQPMVLNASVTPTAAPLESVALLTVESIVAVFCASSVTLPVPPPAVLVVTVSSLRYAFDLESTVLVAITPFTANCEPDPQALPPEAEAVLSALAWITASSSALNVTAPAFTVA